MLVYWKGTLARRLEADLDLGLSKELVDGIEKELERRSKLEETDTDMAASTSNSKIAFRTTEPSQGQTLSEITVKRKTVAFTEVNEVVRDGKQIIIPKGMTIEKAMSTLQKRADYENEVTSFTEVIEAYPWDGAHALGLALQKKYGWASPEPIPSMFGDKPPQVISIPSGVGTTINIAWGRFSIPGITGWIQTSLSIAKGKLVFVIAAQVQRKYEAEVKAIADLTRTYVREHSLYRGKSIQVSFDNGFESMPEFLDVSSATEERLVFSDEVRDAIQINLFTPIEQYQNLRKAGIPFKRGVLLAGKYGTGKTESAFTAANKANAQGITFVYVKNAKEFPSAVTFAKAYSPAVVFCEDIDRVTAGERDADMDEILNTVDGIEAKISEVLTVLTTNEVKRIHKGMIRPGRIDAVIEVYPPDAVAVTKLMTLYGRGLIKEGEDLSVAGHILAGQIPATIREVVERAKLAALRRVKNSTGIMVVNADDLVASAKSMTMQLDLLNRTDVPTKSDFQRAMECIGESIKDGMDMVTMAKELGPDRVHISNDSSKYLAYSQGEGSANNSGSFGVKARAQATVEAVDKVNPNPEA